MANHASAKKRIRQTVRKNAVNGQRLSAIRSYVRKVEEAIEGGEKPAAQQALRELQPHYVRGATKGPLHKKTVSRKLSRLQRRVNTMGAA